MTASNGMTEDERYLFDTFGYIILPDVIDMAHVERLRATLKMPTEQFEPVDQADSPLHWDAAWRDLLDLPKLTPVLEDLLGNHQFRERFREQKERDPYPSYRLDHINVHTHITGGYAGGMLHGGWQHGGGCQFYRFHEGQFYNGLLAVSFELFDTSPNGGGFACIPGSHKGNLEIPESWRDLSKSVHPAITRVRSKPGDAVVFTEALIHGTLPWNVAERRETIFYKFSPHGTTWSADFFDPDDFVAYDDMDARKLSLLEPPNARYSGRPTRPELPRRV